MTERKLGRRERFVRYMFAAGWNRWLLVTTALLVGGYGQLIEFMDELRAAINAQKDDELLWEAESVLAEAEVRIAFEMLDPDTAQKVLDSLDAQQREVLARIMVPDED